MLGYEYVSPGGTDILLNCDSCGELHVQSILHLVAFSYYPKHNYLCLVWKLYISRLFLHMCVRCMKNHIDSSNGTHPTRQADRQQKTDESFQYDGRVYPRVEVWENPVMNQQPVCAQKTLKKAERLA